MKQKSKRYDWNVTEADDRRAAADMLGYVMD